MKKLSRQKIRALAMHGNKSQGQRSRALADFEDGRCDTLVATDVASRGIDVDDITHVINFDAPADRDGYVHRTGRTGRAGASGVAASFVLPDQHGEMRKIATDLGLHREFDSGPGFEHAARQHSRNGGSGNGAASGKSREGADLQRPSQEQPTGTALGARGGALPARRLHAGGLIEVDLPEPDGFGGHLDALVRAKELESLL